MSNSKRISVVVPTETKNNLQALCDVENRSMSNFVKLLIESAIKKAKEKGKI